MAVATGDPRVIPFTINATVGGTAVVGQGQGPILWALISTDLLNDATPYWTTIDPLDVRDFETNRGRNSEREDFDAGTATLTLDNRDRAFDPTYPGGAFFPNLRPLNQLWLREQFNGVTNDLFKGYIESFDLTQPGPGMSDSLCVITAADEFKLLNLDGLPVMDPPDAGSYSQVVAADNPASYFAFSDALKFATHIVTETFPATDPVFVEGEWFNYWISAKPSYTVQTVTVSGSGWTQVAGSSSIVNETPIVGDQIGSTEDGAGGALQIPSGGQLDNEDLDVWNMQGGTYGAIEFWVKLGSLPGSNQTFLWGPGSTSAGPSPRIWTVRIDAASTLTFTYKRQDTGADTTITSATVLQAGRWYHIVMGLDGFTNKQIWVNGVLDASAAFPAGFENSSATTQPGSITSAATSTVTIDEIAHYRNQVTGIAGMDPARIAAHYTAGTARGFQTGKSGARASDVLDAVHNPAPRALQLGSRTMRPAFMHGQGPLEELRSAAGVEQADGMLFIAANGAVTLLADTFKASAPYNTVQLTFSDDGTGSPALPYEGIPSENYSDAMIANVWNVSRQGPGGTLQTSSDATSITRYRSRPQSINNVPVLVNADALAIAASYKAKYRNPLLRIFELELDCNNQDVLDQVLRFDLGTRVRVIRTLPRGLGTWDQNLFIQSINVQGQDEETWKIKLGVGDKSFDALQ